VVSILTLLPSLLLLAPPSPAAATGARSPADSVVGEVVAIGPGADRLTVKTDAGASLEIRLAANAVLRRARPGVTDLSQAAPVSFAEIAVNDRVLARGRLSEDETALVALQLVVMSRTDIAERQQQELADWRRRSVLGIVTAVDTASGEVTLRLPGLFAGRSLIVETAGRPVAFRRYTPESVRFSDALPSALAQVRVGDQLRALGERSEDGSRLLAEQVVFGSFVNATGTVVSVDAAGGTLVMKDDASGKAVTVQVAPEARLRVLPPELAARLGRPREAQRPAAEAEAPAADRRPTAARAEAGRLRRGGGEDFLERLPATTLADIKPGSRIVVASPKAPGAEQLRAIALVTGLEAIPAPAARGGRQGRGPGPGLELPPELSDLGMGIQ
jgi:hypothetical protein